MLFQKIDMVMLQRRTHEKKAHIDILIFFFQREKLDINAEHLSSGEVLGLLDMDFAGYSGGIVEETLEQIRVEFGFLGAIEGREENFCGGFE